MVSLALMHQIVHRLSDNQSIITLESENLQWSYFHILFGVSIYLGNTECNEMYHIISVKFITPPIHR
jgi:hypothetical protein